MMKTAFTILGVIALLLGHVGAQASGEQPRAAQASTERDDWQLPAEKENFHIFLLMGQSNMAGGIKKHQPGHLLPEDQIPVPHIVQVKTNISAKKSGWFPAAHPLHYRPGRPNSFGLGIPFAEKHLEKNPGVTVGLLPNAYGGKRMDLLKKGSGLYRSAIEKAKYAMERGTIKGVLWHQGESDAWVPEREASYEEKLHQLVADVREDLGIPDLPFIVGELTRQYPATNKVQLALKTLPEKVENTAWVNINDLTFVDAPKNVHFDRESYIKLGHRYCDALLKVMKKE